MTINKTINAIDAASFRALLEKAGFQKSADGKWNQVRKALEGSYEELIQEVNIAVRNAGNQFCTCGAAHDYSTVNADSTFDGGVFVRCWDCGGMWFASWEEDEDTDTITITDIQEAQNLLLLENGTIIKASPEYHQSFTEKVKSAFPKVFDKLHPIARAAAGGKLKGKKKKAGVDDLGDMGTLGGCMDDGASSMAKCAVLLKEAGQRWMLWSSDGGKADLLDLNKMADGGFVEKSDDEPDEDVIEIPIIKADAEQHLVYGLVYEPDTEDTQGDGMTADEIEKTAHTYNANYRLVNKQHKTDVNADVVESYIAPVDFELGGQSIKKGSWLLVTRANDPKVWEDIKKGKLGGYSMEGYGRRKAVK